MCFFANLAYFLPLKQSNVKNKMQKNLNPEPIEKAFYAAPLCETAAAEVHDILCDSFDGSGFDDYTDETI